MATQLSEAWNALRAGRYQQAKESFQSALENESDAAYTYLGLATASLATGNLRDATSFAERSLQESHTPEAHLLTAELHSRSGNRREAESHLESYFSDGGASPYAHALLGEQRIRTARWEQGFDDYMAALSEDPDGLAFRQLQRVLKDLVDAVHSGPLPAEPAKQFVNKIEYTLSNPPSGAQSYFATVRRALNSGSRIQEPRGRAPIFDVLEHVELPEDSPSFDPPPEAAADSADNSKKPPPAPSSEQSSRRVKGIDPKQKDLAGVIQRDRSKNEQLQEAIGTMGPPDWPSASDENEIDPLPTLAWEEQSIYAGEPGMDATTFRITSGSVRAEIFLERCLQNLLAGAKQDRAVSVRFRPEAITRIEVNCWDGLLDRLPPMSPIYDEFHEADKYEQLALGRFLGECVAVAYDGTWDFAEPPENSKLIVGNRTLDPLGLAERWVNTSDPDEIDLTVLDEQAAKASEESTSMTIEQNYIDPTSELQGKSLAVKLAELWTDYLFRFADTSFAEIAKTVTVHETTSTAIVFSMGTQYCPEVAKGPGGSARREEGTVSLGYLRERGEILLMSSRKHAARTARAGFGSLTSENASKVVAFLANHHRPGWTWVRNESSARRLQNESNLRAHPPKLQQTERGRQLQVSVVDHDRRARTVQLTAPDAGRVWELQVK